ncbi:MAG: alginate export family protein [Deferrisomatales bacterium]
MSGQSIGTKARRLGGVLGVAALVAAGAATPAAAAVGTWQKGGLALGLNLQLAAGYFNTDNTNFGAGVDGAGEPGNTDVNWSEGYVKPGVDLSYTTPAAGTFYGAWTLVGSGTRQDGDALGTTGGHPEHFDQEHLFAGWRSGDLFPGLGTDALDVSFGQRELQVGDGFLIWDGTFDFDDRGAYWLAPHLAFKRAGLVRLQTQPVGGELFYLKSDHSQGHTELVGANVEYRSEALGTAGAMYLNVLDSDFDTRDGMQVLDLRAQGTPLAPWGVKDLFLSFEYVYERNRDSAADLDATAWYLEGGYTLSALPWSPSLSYRYSRFSGSEPGSADVEDFDPLFYGFSRGWGTWYMGEVTGEYLLFNSNEEVHMVHLSGSPTDSLGVGAVYYKFLLNEKQYYGTAVSDDEFADEVNVYADWAVNDRLWVSGVFAVAYPGDGAKSAFGASENYTLFEVYATVTF